jgi:glycerol-3-phosphate dehydrogenase (NAD(P)+)
MTQVTFIGGGTFGTALAAMLGNEGYKVAIWDRKEYIVDDINLNKQNKKYLKNSSILKNVTAYNDIEKAIDGSDIVVLAVPSHVIREISKKVSKYLKEGQIIVSIAKGIEEGTLKRLSSVINEEIANNPVVVLSGPSHAEEVAANIPTTVVVSSEKMEYAKKIQDVFMTENFRVYTNDDLIGVEIGGAVKNIIALAAGVLDGIGYGDNAKAALMTRGMSEIIRIGIKMGGKQETFYGLTGMGDLIVTCTSMHSRNRRAGILIGKGYKMEEASSEVGMVVEGIKACRAFYDLKEQMDISMPITDALYNALFNNKDPKQEVYNLMTRDKKDEI